MEKAASEQSPFSKVIQIGIVVRDMDKAVKRLSSLGIGTFKPKLLPPDRKEWFRGRPFDGEVILSSASIGEMEIELVQPVAGESPHQEFLDRQGEGIQHIACAVKDLEGHVEKLTNQGCHVLLRARFPGGGGVAYMDLGVAGLIIELIERK